MKPSGAGERDGAFGGGGGDVLDEGEGEHAGEVEQGRGLGVEELLLVVAHGVFKGAEEGKELFEGELPEGVGAGLVAGQVEVLDGAEVVAVVLGDIGDDFGGERVGRGRGAGAGREPRPCRDCGCLGRKRTCRRRACRAP